ncbi:hypothetical protein LAZ67_9000820 [Cordylochernes scorpioides]|uniref:HTH CENPB-type domain-containing protein n=1 Tax=Cordylochernes scorpioides TaxID=51811 RepID=A0ABY6KUB8_9ARAC|nr:hypothetical protein LAZ67_9000820 [Cordylochernes scorpioides]
MGPVKKYVERELGKKKDIITMEAKREMIEKHERGMRKKKELRELDAAKGVTRLSKQRPRLLEEVENLILVWINEKQLTGDTITQNLICEKAKALNAELGSKIPCTSIENEVHADFKASKGWFENFKRRSGIHSVTRHGEGASSDAKAAETFTAEFEKLVVTECYLPQQVFNCDETGLFWKKMPKRTYITAEANTMPGHKPMKDRLTLLLCANASGDLKVKPLLVYHSENPRAFKKHKVQKSQLNVLWKSNTKAWVTRLLALLVMDNAPAHPPSLKDHLLDEFKFIEVRFLPPNTTPLLQPMDQQVISNFKKIYIKELFQRCFELTEETNLTLREFWQNHFNIVQCLKIIDKAWNGVSQRTLVSAWTKLWPHIVHAYDFKGLSGEQEPPIIDIIVSLGKTLGLEVNEPIIQELVEEEDQELTTNELIDLHREQHQEVKEVISSGKEEDENSLGSLPSDQIREICKMWETVQLFVAKHHPNKPAALRATDQFNDNAMSHFREILKKRQKQQSLDHYAHEVWQINADSHQNRITPTVPQGTNTTLKRHQFPLTEVCNLRAGGKSMATALQKIDMDPEQQLYTPKIVDIATARYMETSEALHWTRQQQQYSIHSQDIEHCDCCDRDTWRHLKLFIGHDNNNNTVYTPKIEDIATAVIEMYGDI